LTSRQIPLATTQAGLAISAEGHVDIRLQGQRQRLKVEVEARVPDGTVFRVFANGVELRPITIHFGEGEFEFDSENGGQLPGGLSPGAITPVAVTSASGAFTPVLVAQFGATPSNAAQTNTSATDVRTRTALTQTSAGKAIGAHGTAQVRVQGQKQQLKVEVEADSAGPFLVFANGIKLGQLILRLGEGEFELQNENAMLPIGLDSIAAIKNIQVTDLRGVRLLEATLQ
jgi:hypothetical protein